ncbi:MAG: helix-turn-helix transcriptional regulator [Erysipelotrichaceae bacterium]|nr:helix-turn-helix transcriptional regulator [Erysipelotrichaceae bacterium]
MDKKELGANIRSTRKAKGLSQNQLAELMGYKDHSTLAKVETGVNDITVETLYKYADKLEIDVQTLLSIKSELDIFNDFCEENKLDIFLSTKMPKGYEKSNGTFDITKKSLFYNVSYLKELPYYERIFYLFHELRHADQYFNPQKYSEEIKLSSRYSIMFDGTCSKLINNNWKECKLNGKEEYYINLYLNQPYEIDANQFAYQETKKIVGKSKELDKLIDFWTPKETLSFEEIKDIYKQIDKLCE